MICRVLCGQNVLFICPYQITMILLIAYYNNIISSKYILHLILLVSRL